MQLPGTLPFKNLNPHDGQAIMNLPSGSSPAVGGKLRVYKSGKVVMRFTRADGSKVDFLVSRGI